MCRSRWFLGCLSVTRCSDDEVAPTEQGARRSRRGSISPRMAGWDIYARLYCRVRFHYPRGSGKLLANSYKVRRQVVDDNYQNCATECHHRSKRQPNTMSSSLLSPQRTRNGQRGPLDVRVHHRRQLRTTKRHLRHIN